MNNLSITREAYSRAHRALGRKLHVKSRLNLFFRILRFLLAAALSFPALAHTDFAFDPFCGTARERTSVAFSSSVTTDRQPLLSIKGIPGKIELPITFGEIQHACLASDDKLAVFVWLTGACGIAVLHFPFFSLIDSFWAYNPTVSPSGRFVVYREFYSYSTEVPMCKMYLLYDLTLAVPRKSLVFLGSSFPLGRLVYPRTPGAAAFEQGSVAFEKIHYSASERFFWAADESSVVFGDRVGDAFHVVMVKTSAPAHALRYQVNPKEVCSPWTGPVSSLQLADAEVRKATVLGRSVYAQFKVTGQACFPKPLNFTRSDFREAPIKEFPPPVRNRISKELKT